jgi:WD40 repeat protein
MRFALFVLLAVPVARAADAPKSPSLPAPAGGEMRLDRHAELQWSADGSVLLSVDLLGTAKAWNPDTKELIRTHEPPKIGSVFKVLLSPDGETLVVGSRTGPVRVSEAKTGKELKSFKLPGNAVPLAFAPDGSELAVATDAGAVRFYDPHTLKQKGKDLPVPGGVKELAYRPDSKAVAVCEAKSSALRVFDTKTGKALVSVVNKAGTSPPAVGGLVVYHGYNSPVWSPDGKLLVAHAAGRIGEPGKYCVFDAATGKERAELPGRAFGFSPDSKYALCHAYRVKDKGTGHATHLVEVETGKVVLSFGNPAGALSSALHAGSARLARVRTEGAIEVCDLNALPEVRTIDAHPGASGRGSVRGLAFAPDGETFATFGGASGAERVSVWEAGTGKRAAGFALPGVRRLAFVGSTDPELATFGAQSGPQTRFWSPAGKERPSPFPEALFVPAVSPNGALAPVADQKGLRDEFALSARARDTGKVRAALGTFAARAPEVCAFAPDGARLAAVFETGANQYALHVWDAATGKELPAVKPHLLWCSALARSPDGQVLAVGGRDRVQLYEAATGKELGAIRFPFQNVAQSQRLALAWSPDGKALAVANAEYAAAVLYEVSTGRVRAVLREQGTVWVSAVAWSPDGTTVAAAGDVVKLWDATAKPKPLWELVGAK